MPSPFAGMDPFIERFVWSDFHTRLNTVIAEFVTPNIRPNYVARIEHRVVVESGGDRPQARVPDVAVIEEWSPAGGGGTAVLDQAVAEPVVVSVGPTDRKHHYIEIRDPDSGRVVTVIETLSPANKRPGSKTRIDYERKRDELLLSDATLVEIDLLRGGEPFDCGWTDRAGTYRVFISKPWERPRAELYPVGLMERLPVVPIPLGEADEPVPLSLQRAVDTVYERADYSNLRYETALDPPLPESVTNWLAEAVG